MKKTTGKVVSLVLALALVVTSFSGTFAFAASATGKVTFGGDDTTTMVIYAHTGVLTAVKVPDPAITYTNANGVKFDTVVSNGTIAWKSSDTTIANVDGTGVTNAAVLKEGTATITATYSNVVLKDGATGTNSVTVDGVGSVTVKAVAEGKSFLTTAAAFATYTGKELPLQTKLSVNATPTYTVAKTDAVGTSAAVTYGADSDYDSIAMADKSTTAAIKMTIPGKIDAQPQTPKLTTGQVLANKTPASTATQLVANIQIVKEYDAAASAILNSDTTYGQGGKTLPATGVGYDLTGYTINAAGAITVNGGSVAAIKGTSAALTMAGGTVGSFDGASVASFSKGTIGSVKTTGTVTMSTDAIVTGAVDATNDVTLTGGVIGGAVKGANVSLASAKTGAVTATGTVIIDSTTVNGNVTGTSVDVKANQVDANAKGIAAKVNGNITGTLAINVGLVSDKADVTVTGAILSNAATKTVTLAQNATVNATTTTTVGSVVGHTPVSPATADTTLVLNNYKKGFASLVNINKVSVLGATDATVNSAVNLDDLQITSGKVTFANGATLSTMTAAAGGTIAFPAGKLVVKSAPASAGNVTLEPKGTIGVGTIIFKSVTGQKDAFKLVGLTLVEKNNGDSTYNYVVDKSEFAGLSISDSSIKVANGYSKTLTLTALPAGSKLPAGLQTKWEVTADKNVTVTPSADGLSAVVKATGWSKEDLNFVNEATVTVTVVDKDGNRDWKYDANTCDVTVVEKADVVSDTNNDFSVNAGSTYQFKITSSTAPVFTLGTGGVFTVAPVSHVAGSNDYFYKITATGKVGAAAGIYLNGNKLLVVTVKAAAFKSDTTMKATVKGAYTVKITAPAVPTFTIGTSGVFTAKFVSKTGNDYFYKITSVGKVGTQAGIYVNGVKTFVGIVG